MPAKFHGAESISPTAQIESDAPTAKTVYDALRGFYNFYQARVYAYVQQNRASLSPALRQCFPQSPTIPNYLMHQKKPWLNAGFAEGDLIFDGNYHRYVLRSPASSFLSPARLAVQQDLLVLFDLSELLLGFDLLLSAEQGIEKLGSQLTGEPLTEGQAGLLPFSSKWLPSKEDEGGKEDSRLSVFSRVRKPLEQEQKAHLDWLREELPNLLKLFVTHLNVVIQRERSRNQFDLADKLFSHDLKVIWDVIGLRLQAQDYQLVCINFQEAVSLTALLNKQLHDATTANVEKKVIAAHAELLDIFGSSDDLSKAFSDIEKMSEQLAPGGRSDVLDDFSQMVLKRAVNRDDGLEESKEKAGQSQEEAGQSAPAANSKPVLDDQEKLRKIHQTLSVLMKDKGHFAKQILLGLVLNRRELTEAELGSADSVLKSTGFSTQEFQISHLQALAEAWSREPAPLPEKAETAGARSRKPTPLPKVPDAHDLVANWKFVEDQFSAAKTAEELKDALGAFAKVQGADVADVQMQDAIHAEFGVTGGIDKLSRDDLLFSRIEGSTGGFQSVGLEVIRSKQKALGDPMQSAGSRTLKACLEDKLEEITARKNREGTYLLPKCCDGAVLGDLTLANLKATWAFMDSVFDECKARGYGTERIDLRGSENRNRWKYQVGMAFLEALRSHLNPSNDAAGQAILEALRSHLDPSNAAANQAVTQSVLIMGDPEMAGFTERFDSGPPEPVADSGDSNDSYARLAHISETLGRPSFQVKVADIQAELDKKKGSLTAASSSTVQSSGKQVPETSQEELNTLEEDPAPENQDVPGICGERTSGLEYEEPGEIQENLFHGVSAYKSLLAKQEELQASTEPHKQKQAVSLRDILNYINTLADQEGGLDQLVTFLGLVTDKALTTQQMIDARWNQALQDAVESWGGQTCGVRNRTTATWGTPFFGKSAEAGSVGGPVFEGLKALHEEMLQKQKLSSTVVVASTWV